MIHESSGLEKSLLSYSTSKLIRIDSKMLTHQSEVSLGVNISATIDPISIVPMAFLISSFQEVLPLFKCKQIFFFSFLFCGLHLCFKQPYCHTNKKARDFRNSPKSILDQHDKSFICTKFQAFTTFSAISTCICGTIIRWFKFNQTELGT